MGGNEEKWRYLYIERMGEWENENIGIKKKQKHVECGGKELIVAWMFFLYKSSTIPNVPYIFAFSTTIGPFISIFQCLLLHFPFPP